MAARGFNLMPASQPQRNIEGREALLCSDVKLWQDADLILSFCKIPKKHACSRSFPQQPVASSPVFPDPGELIVANTTSSESNAWLGYVSELRYLRSLLHRLLESNCCTHKWERKPVRTANNGRSNILRKSGRSGSTASSRLGCASILKSKCRETLGRN